MSAFVAVLGSVYTCTATAIGPYSIKCTVDGIPAALAPQICSHGNINTGFSTKMTADGIPVVLKIHPHTGCFGVYPPHPPAPFLPIPQKATAI